MAYKKTKSTRTFLTLIVLGVIATSTYYMANVLIKRAQTLQAGAAAGTASFFFEPSGVTLPTSSQLNLWVTADQPVAFVHARVKFNHNLIQLTQSPTLNAPTLSRVISQTSVSSANSSGILDLVVGLDPSNRSTQLIGNFSLATLKFSPKTSDSTTTTVSLDNSASQVVDIGAIPFNLQSTSANLVLNPSTSSSPTPTPSATPQSSDTTPPTLTVRGPVEGQSYPTDRNLYIGLRAEDASGISKIEFYFDGTLVKTCSRQTLCEFGYKVPYEQVPVGTHTVTLKAYDKSPAANMSSATRTVIR